MLQGENTPQRIHFDFAKGKSSITKAKIDQGGGGRKILQSNLQDQ